MKKIFLFFLFFSAVAFSCQTIQLDDFFGYIAGVNSFKEHFSETFIGTSNLTFRVSSIKKASLPITLWFVVNPITNGYSLARFDDETQEWVFSSDQWNSNVVRSTLYYKIVPSGKTYDDTSCKWRLASDLDFSANPIRSPEDPLYSHTDYQNFPQRLKLHGVNCLSLGKILANGDTIASGDLIIFAWVCKSTFSQSLNDITPGSSSPYYRQSEGNYTYSGIDTEQLYILGVEYNGLQTPVK